MKNTFILLAACILYSCKTQQTLNTGFIEDGVRVIKNVNVFTGHDYIENINVVINDTLIVDISENIDKYVNIEIIDGTNKTIIPPLANAHIHLWFPASLKSALDVGIFANFDMHNSDASANNIRLFKDSINYSKFYSSNAAATVPGGHGTQFGIAVPTINDTVSAEQFVQDRIKANADYIKVIKEPMMNTLSDEQTLGVIEEAHIQKVLAVGHSHRIEETMVLVEQNIDGIVHIWFDKKASPEQLAQMRDSGVFLVPTILVTKKLLDMGKSQGRSMNVLEVEEVLKEIKYAHDAGITILCGTDSPNFGLNYSTSIFDEMDLLHEAGLSNEEVLKSATVNIYKAFELEDFDTLEPGAKANFIIVDGNPVKNISDIRRSKVIYRNGSIINQSAIDN